MKIIKSSRKISINRKVFVWFEYKKIQGTFTMNYTISLPNLEKENKVRHRKIRWMFLGKSNNVYF